jgi:hypothetical protein
MYRSFTPSVSSSEMTIVDKIAHILLSYCVPPHPVTYLPLIPGIMLYISPAKRRGGCKRVLAPSPWVGGHEFAGHSGLLDRYEVST